MIEWIELNKEWVFSGAGILIISSIISFISVLLTLWWKSYLEKKKIKKLSVLHNITKFSIPFLENTKNIQSEHIKVSYKGNEYENLSLYNIQIKNIGNIAIENQKLHIIFPIETDIVEVFENKSLESIQIKKEEIKSLEKKEIIYEFKRLETSDICTISYLLDLKDIKSINFELRGVDNIEYIYKDDVNLFEIKNIIIYIAIFIFADSIPFFNSLIQALMIIGATPFIIEFLKKLKSFKKPQNNVLNINGDISLDKSGKLSINQLIK